MKKIVCLLCLLSCAALSGAQDYSVKPAFSVIMDSSKGPLMIRQCSREHPTNVTGFWNISPEQIKVLEKNYKKLLAVRIHDGFGNTRVYNLSKYVYQYMGLTIDGEKYIYINASGGFIGGDKNNWKENPVVVCDGGAGYWGVLFNLNKLKFSQLAFDGNI